MKSLIKVMLVLAVFFASTFLIINLTGLISVEKIETWLVIAKSVDITVIMFIVIALLLADLFIAVPTLSVMILAGYFLGPQLGALISIVGLSLAGVSGYIISWRFGDKLVKHLIKSHDAQVDMRTSFNKHGTGIILLSRALPILPEVSACMAGMTKMPFNRFLLFWTLSTVPYAIIATYSGSVSSLQNPKPAILTAVGLTSMLWLGWLVYSKVSGLSLNKSSLN